MCIRLTNMNMNKDAKILMKYLNEKYPDEEYTKRLNQNYDGELSEETPKNLENLTSYTIDKKEIVSCLRTKTKNNLHDQYKRLLFINRIIIPLKRNLKRR